jgi:hypothetical protein
MTASPKEAANLGPAEARRQGWQRGLVGVDPLALLDHVQDALGQRRQMEADMAHPVRHGGAADLDACRA